MVRTMVTEFENDSAEAELSAAKAQIGLFKEPLNRNIPWESTAIPKLPAGKAQWLRRVILCVQPNAEATGRRDELDSEGTPDGR